MVIKKRTRKWSWPVSILFLIVFLDLCALTWYFWAIPEQHFENWKKIVSIIGSWLGSTFTFFGIRYKFKREQSIAQVLKIRPVQLCIVAITIIIWYFVLPFHSVTISVQQFDSKAPLSGVTVKVDDEKASRGAFSDENGKIKIRGLNARAYNLRFELDGYKPGDVTISFIDVISPWSSSGVLLEKGEAMVELTTIPEGAEIYLDGDEGEAIGITPQTISIPTGKHKIMFKKGGYHSTLWEEIFISIGDNLSLSKKLRAKIGPPQATYPLTVSSEPQGAHIYVNDVFKGSTPTTIRLTEGEHRIKIIKSGYETKRDVVIIEKKPRIITFDLEKSIQKPQL